MLNEIDKKFGYTSFAFSGLSIAIMLTGLVIVFIWKRENLKPTFIKVIWVLLCLAEFAAIVNLTLYEKLDRLDKDGD